MLEGAGFCSDTRTIVNPTSRSKESKDWGEKLLQEMNQPEEVQESSMVVKDEGSMIVKEDEGSMVIKEGDGSVILRESDNKANSNFLNQYISDLRSTSSAADDQKSKMKQRITTYDEACLLELEKIYDQHKKKI